MREPEQYGGPPCCPHGIPRGSDDRRGSCPSGRRSCRHASEECCRPQAEGSGPGGREVNNEKRRM